MHLSEQDYKKKINFQIVGHDMAQSFYYRVKDNPKLIIAADIETAESNLPEDERDDLQDTYITQIQFATDKYNAFIFPRFEGVYKELTQKILQLSNLKVGHNIWNFDNPIIQANQIEFDATRVHDTMWMYKHWSPKTPRGLQPVAGLAGFPFPWKHLFGAQMDVYGGCDVCSLHFILEWLPPLMKSLGVWEGYQKYTYQFRAKLLYPAQTLGLPVNDEKREILKTRLIKRRDTMDKELQELIPIDLRNFQPRRKITLRDDATGTTFDTVEYGYKREPKKDINLARERYNGIVELAREQGKTVKPFESFLALKYQLVKRRFTEFNLESGKEVEVEKWAKFLPFKSSKEQLSKYIVWRRTELLKKALEQDPAIKVLKGGNYRSKIEAVQDLIDQADEYQIPKTHDGKETTGKKELEILLDKTGDEVVEKCLEIRSLGTNINNYIPNWKPNRNTGAVHTTFGYSAASGQIDSRRPNVLNVSKHTEVGQEFRWIIDAPEGYEFLEADKKSFHVATMGYACNDASYIRFSQLDPHSIFTSYIMPKDWGKPIDLSLPDDEILDICKWIKKRCKQEKDKLGDRGVDIRQQQAKPCVLGNQLGLGPKKLWYQNRRSIADVGQAKYLQAVIADLFNKVERGKKEIKTRARDLTYLKNEFGFIQWFFDVYNYGWNKKANGGNGGWEEREGDEARDALAFAVQSPAFGMIKDEAFRIVDRLNPLLGEFPFRLSIHDSLIFMYRREYREQVIEVVVEEMNKPCSRLVNEATGPEGLKVGVEYEIGRNWKKYHEVDNPEGMKG